MTNDSPETIDTDIIEALARDSNRSIDEVRAVFEAEFERLKQNARVTDYLVLFASRRTADILASRNR